MTYLIVSATGLEAAALAKELGSVIPQSAPAGSLFRGDPFSFLICGVGQMMAGIELTAALLEQNYDGVINIGIAGSFNPAIPKLTVVQVTEEVLADLGTDDANGFSDIFEMKLAEPNCRPFEDRMLRNATSALVTPTVAKLQKVRSLTVNRVLSNADEIARVARRYSPDIVNMEGAAVFYACLRAAVPVLQLRAISDTVGPRDKSAWDVSGAVSELTKVTSELLSDLRVLAS